MSTGAGLHRHLALWLPSEKRKDSIATHPLSESNASGCVRSMSLKDILRQIQANHANVHLGRLLFRGN